MCTRPRIRPVRTSFRVLTRLRTKSSFPVLTGLPPRTGKRGRKIFTKTASLLPPAVPTAMRERRFLPPENNGRLMNAAAKSGWRKRGCLSRQKCAGCANRRPVRCRPVWLKITATTAESGFSSCRKTLPAGRVFCIPEISGQAEESFLGAERSNENGGV